MTESDIKINWYYFRSLASQLQQTEQYVDHSLDSNGNMSNGLTFSNEFVKIMMLASSEFEIICKAICAESGISLTWNANILTITKEILAKYPRIGETKIATPYLSFKPLQNWEIIKVNKPNGKIEEKVNGIQWWQDHNNLKHNRRNTFAYANLNNCISAMSSLMVVELYLSQIVIDNVDLITSMGCSYFETDYGLSPILGNVGIKLPDFEK